MQICGVGSPLSLYHAREAIGIMASMIVNGGIIVGYTDGHSFMDLFGQQLCVRGYGCC